MKVPRSWALVVALSWAMIPEPALAQVVVGSKNFSESRLLAEIFAQAVEARTDLSVDRRFNLAGTAICFQAVQSGDIHVYPEYTGTGLVTLLGEDAVADPTTVLTRVRRVFRDRWDVEWLAPLGFENAYEVAVRRELAETHGLRSIGDLVPLDDELRFAFGYEFQEREDGLLGLRRVYGLEPGSLVGMQQNLKYDAAGSGKIDVLDVYTTDGLILVHDLVVLEDDRGVFPPYEAAPLVQGGALRRWPELGNALTILAGTLSESTMRSWNRRVEVDGEPIESVASEFLATLGVIGSQRPETGPLRRGSGFWRYMAEHWRELLTRTGEHLILVGVSMAFGILVAIPLALMVYRNARTSEAVIRLVGILQTIPSIALLAFMIPILGVGAVPAVVALFLYSLFPMVRATVTGVREAGPAAVQSATALGMTPGQVLRHVRIPLAVPIILAGIRTSAVISVGTATLAAFIGAGGLGQPIVAGLQLNSSTVVLSGAIPAAILAVLVDLLLARWQRSLQVD